MELIYCKFWAYPNSILPLVAANFATKFSYFILSVISLSTVANIKLSSLGWVIVVRNFDLTTRIFSDGCDPPPIFLLGSARISWVLKMSRGEAHPPLGPPRGYATANKGTDRRINRRAGWTSPPFPNTVMRTKLRRRLHPVISCVCISSLFSWFGIFWNLFWALISTLLIKNPPTAKCLSGKSTNGAVVFPKIHQLLSQCSW